jgi:hypothetical protein
MKTIADYGFTIAAAGTSAYLGLEWMLKQAAQIFIHMAGILPNLH